MRKHEGHKRKNERHKMNHERHKMKLEVNKNVFSNFWKIAIKKNIGFLIKICINKCNKTIAERGYPTKAPKSSQPFTIIGLFALHNNRKIVLNILKKQYVLLICLGFEGIPDRRHPRDPRDPQGPSRDPPGTPAHI